MISQRTITIASYWKPYYVQFRNLGFPGGIALQWRGKRDWCQPGDFLRWAEVVSFVKRRLELAGLALVGELPEPPDSYQFKPLVVQVGRLHRKLRKRAYETPEIKTPTDGRAAVEQTIAPAGGAAIEQACCPAGHAA